MAAAEVNPYAVKRSGVRCWVESVVSFGLVAFFWLYNYRRLIDGEIGDGRDDATIHTVFYVVPVLNFFVVYWLWRDLDYLRQRSGLPAFPVVGYVIGSIFLAPVFFTIVNAKLNEYWDVRTEGHAVDAPVVTAEKALMAIGGLLLAFYVLAIVASIIAAVGSATS